MRIRSQEPGAAMPTSPARRDAMHLAGEPQFVVATAG
jgi:hypothetical protein